MESEQWPRHFLDWAKEYVLPDRKDLVYGGASSGACGEIIYNNDCKQIIDCYGDEIWELIAAEAEDIGSTVLEVIKDY